MNSDPKNSAEQWIHGNYCVSFIDLLGQRDALREQKLLPSLNTPEERENFDKILRDSTGAIIDLQKAASGILEPYTNPRSDSPLRQTLSPDLQVTWDRVNKTDIRIQRWSDGLVLFVLLGDTEIQCPMNGVFGILATAGMLCLRGLARRNPIRGAIEVSWGVEINSGELYGAAVARAYELESLVAQYPRIVVGDEAVKLLEAYSSHQADDLFSQQNRGLAKTCLDMLVKDADGYWMLHFLGAAFQNAVTGENHVALQQSARRYILEQLYKYRALRNSKLAFRYVNLLQYFDEYPINAT